MGKREIHTTRTQTWESPRHPFSSLIRIWKYGLTPLLFPLLTCMGVQAEEVNDSVPTKAIHHLGFDVHPSYVIPTHRFIKGKNTKGEPIRFTLSGHLKYAFQFAEGSRFNRMYPYAYQGFGVGYNRFLDSDDFGHPWAIYALQGSRLAKLGRKLTLDYEWNFGVSFGWKEYNQKTHERNHVIGTDLDAYMDLAFLLNWKMSRNWRLTAGIGFTHCSNGNTHYPNQGINLVESKIGVVRTLNAPVSTKDEVEEIKPSLRQPRHISYDLIAFGGFRVRELHYEGIKYIPDENFVVCGLNFSPMYHFNNNVRAGVSLDLLYDESSNLEKYVTGVEHTQVVYQRQPFHEKLSAGLSIRGEWAMPIFSINAGIGYNVYAKSFDTKRFYQILAMKLFVSRRLFLHIGYQMNQFSDPNHLMLGLGWRFH